MQQTEAGNPNIVHKVFTFEDEKKTPGETLTVSIPEVLDPQYGMYVWPCAVVLAQFVWTHREELSGKTVLEIGAGVGLPGVVAARCGARLFLSDSSENPSPPTSCCCQNWTWFLGSDVFYDPKDFEDVLVTIAFLLRKNPRARFWTTYQVRSADWSIEVLLQRWDLDCVPVPLDQFHADRPELAGSSLPGRHTVQMMIISRKNG
ncbi:hypothetical protein OJAV_G00084040 [Oryzias javanicus]|uniref:Methyltransferase-like protein 23 n=1 Tax=Oryzias javanicus TaxID=123683 RepID=A0A3S2MMG8_ORYJA|nr:hypothetical protein OJAV_G00084040 [Oryzias javanicus]